MARSAHRGSHTFREVTNGTAKGYRYLSEEEAYQVALEELALMLEDETGILAVRKEQFIKEWCSGGRSESFCRLIRTAANIASELSP